MVVQRTAHQLVERPGWDPGRARGGYLRRSVEHLPDVAPLRGGQGEYRHARDEVECGTDRLEERRSSPVRLRHEVPLVGGDDQPCTRVHRIAGDVTILCHHTLRRVDDQHTHIASLQRSQCAQHAVALDIGVERAPPAQARGVDEAHGASIMRHHRVHRIPRSSRHR